MISASKKYLELILPAVTVTVILAKPVQNLYQYLRQYLYYVLTIGLSIGRFDTVGPQLKKYGNKECKDALYTHVSGAVWEDGAGRLYLLPTVPPAV